MDPRRRLRTLVPEPHSGGYATTSATCAALAVGVAKELAQRVPQQSRTGPRIVVLVDDYEMISAAGQHPLEAVVGYLPSARDIGLHLVVTRRCAGAGRALYDPLLLTLRESGATGVVLSGDRGEGQLFPGVSAQPQPPGRAWWVRRDEPTRLIQTAVVDPDP